jgi:DNA (cytosine-5)-methyltransferase 1
VTKPLLLDLFCGAGGASVGYARAGFDVVGVDLERQPRYPFDFVQADAFEFMRDHGDSRFDVIHASPPCQAFTKAQVIRGRDHADLLTPMRRLLVVWAWYHDIDTLQPPLWVIENVPRAPMRADALLCGSMFGLETKRHRLFESNAQLAEPPPHNHVWPRYGKPVGVYGHTGTKSTGNTSGNHGFLLDDWKYAMNIDWMSRDELAQAIPPAYTEWVGKQLLEKIEQRKKIAVSA